MCDLVYVSLLREKVRRQGAEEKRAAAFVSASPARFVPLILPASREPLTSLQGRATNPLCWSPIGAKAASMNRRDTDDTNSVVRRHSRNTEGM
jgi:hypothetical protein